MTTPSLPPAKLSRPRAFRTVARERLFERLDDLRALPMVWVSGPAGAGKSTLMSSYVEARNAPCIWYQVDEADADLSSFFWTLAQGVERQRGNTMALPLLTADYLSDMAGFTRRFFRLLFAQSDPRQLIVLDNFERAPALAEVLRVAIEEVPSGMTIVVAGRIDAVPELARAAAHGDLAAIGWGALRLDDEEAVAIAQLHGAPARDAAVALNGRCDGWAAGLMVGLAGQGRAPLASSATRLLHDYFASEIFDRLGPAQRDVILATASLPSFTLDMAGAVAGSDAREALETLYRRQCFLSRDDSGESYRYHDLFREFLLARLDALPHERSDELRYRCARALADYGASDEAMLLLARLGRVNELMHLALSQADDLARTGRWQTLSRWLSLLPQDAIDQDGWLLYWRGVSLATVAPQDACSHFERAHALFVDACDKQGILRSALGAIESIFAAVDSYLSLDPWIDAIEPYVEDADAWDCDRDRTRAWYVFLQAALTRRPSHQLIPVGVAWLRARLQSGNATPEETLSAGGVLMFYACIAAADDVALEVMTLTSRHLHRDDVPPVPCWTLLYWQGVYHLWKLQYVDAVHCWEHCTRISAERGLGLLDFLIHGNLVMVDLAEDRLDQAEVRLRALDEAGVRGHRIAYVLFWMGQTFLRLYRGRGDLPEALAAMVQSARVAGLFNLEVLCLGDAAAVHLLRGDEAMAAALLDETESRVKGTVVRQSDGQVIALRAGIQYRQGHIELAHRTFDLAMQEVARGGTCGCMLWVRAGLSALLAEAVRFDQHAATVRELVRRFEIPAPARAGAHWPWPVRIRALGPLSVEVDDSPPAYGRKAQQKVLELLKLLIAEGAREVDGGLVADNLWPDVDGDAAQSNLRGTVKRLREYLGHAESVRLFDGKLSLNERICWLDVWAFRDWCGSLLQDASGEAGAGHGEELRSLYRGPLLQGEQGAWLLAARRRERERFGRVLKRLSSRDETVAGRLRDHALIVDPEAAFA